MATAFAIAAFIVFTILLIRINQVGDRYWHLECELERQQNQLTMQGENIKWAKSMIRDNILTKLTKAEASAPTERIG